MALSLPKVTKKAAYNSYKYKRLPANKVSLLAPSEGLLNERKIKGLAS